MIDYIPRISDQILTERLESKGAVLIEGPKWCGKTTSAKRIAKSLIEMDRPGYEDQYQRMAAVNPVGLLKGDTPHLIDEWQLAPSLWNAVRHEVDRRDAFGQFILTGSAIPAKLPQNAHTGTGRIARMKMRPMSLFESGDSTGAVSLQSLFQEQEISASNDTDLNRIAYLICRGGWPRAVKQKEKVALRQAYDYYDAVVSDDISRVDDIRRDADKTRRLLQSYARHTGTQASLEVIRSDITGNEETSFSADTLYSYLSALKRIHVIEDAPAWNPNLRSKTAIRTTETRYFVDPSIAVASFGAGPKSLVNDLNTMGFLFENMCMRELRIYMDALDGGVSHYRDKSGMECDAVVTRRDGSFGLIEIKLGGDALIEEGAKNLLAFSSKIDTDKMRKPSFMMVLCGVAPFAYRRTDGVCVVPVSCLAP